jgi:hypothetical protein
MTTQESNREVEMISGTREEMAERLVQKLADAGFLFGGARQKTDGTRAGSTVTALLT